MSAVRSDDDDEKTTSGSDHTGDDDRDERGRFLPGNTPANAFEGGQKSHNRCPNCGLGRSKESETEDYVRWHCSRCERTFTARKRYI